MNADRELRRELKARRRQLSPQQIATASRAACTRVLRLTRFRRARRIAGYLSTNGEMDPQALLLRAAQMGKQCFLPVLHPLTQGRLWFAAWKPGDPLRCNRLGIAEPIYTTDRLIHPRWLDLVIVPLLGFDRHCHRIGMGGGYYDRCFAFTRATQVQRRPWLLGLAHESQQLAALDPNPWDITLDQIATEETLYARSSDTMNPVKR